MLLLHVLRPAHSRRWCWVQHVRSTRFYPVSPSFRKRENDHSWVKGIPGISS